MEENRYCISYRIYWSKWTYQLTGHTFYSVGAPLEGYMINDLIENDIITRYGEKAIYESFELIKIFEFKGDEIYGR